MGQDPSQIRQDIETTREQMGDTVEALGHKTDVTGRAKEAVSDKVDTLRSKVSGATPAAWRAPCDTSSLSGVAPETFERSVSTLSETASLARPLTSVL